MNRKIIYFVFSLIFILFACNNKSKSIEEKLRGNSYKYWLIYKYYPTITKDTISFISDDNSIYIDYFDKNGKYFLFYKRDMNSELIKDADHNFTDIVNSDTWSLNGDSCIIINDMNYKIEVLEDDIMILYNPYSQTYTMYLTAPKALIPSKYHNIQ